MRLTLACCIAIALTFFTTGCNGHTTKEDDISLKANNLKLEVIAFKHGQEVVSRVYVEENGERIPYLVLTDDYNGDCLLLREYLLGEPKRFNPTGWYAAYYENSEIDLVLNSEFYETLPQTVRDRIINSTIEITAKKSLGIGGKDSIYISRKIFLLSYFEVNGNGSRTNLKEGTTLEYFSDKVSRIAFYSSGKAGSWWLRTPNTADTDIVCGVSIDGTVGVGGIGGTEGEYVNGLRPAFCLPRDTSITREHINGEIVYVLSL